VLARRRRVSAFDIDNDALEIARENASHFDLEHDIDFVCCDIRELALHTPVSSSQMPFDTVIMNPPFGTKTTQGVDMVFVQKALTVGQKGAHTRKHVDAHHMPTHVTNTTQWLLSIESSWRPLYIHCTKLRHASTSSSVHKRSGARKWRWWPSCDSIFQTCTNSTRSEASTCRSTFCASHARSTKSPSLPSAVALATRFSISERLVRGIADTGSSATEKPWWRILQSPSKRVAAVHRRLESSSHE
jgi:predicted RNA methylase